VLSVIIAFVQLTFNTKILQTQGKYQIKPPLPFILGTEFAGRISKDSPIPKGCPFRPGDRVFGAGQGTYAEKVAVNPGQMLPLPDAMTYDQGAGVCSSLRFDATFSDIT
jgi:NADPH:quinone reductase-like Zn-dependent oxidoreductase